MSRGISQRRAGVVLGYANIITKNFVNLVYTPMLLSFVGQVDYGVYQSCSSFVLSLTLLSFGFSQAYVRFYTQKKASGRTEDISCLNGVYIVFYAVVSAIALALGFFFAANARAVFSAGFTAEQIAIAEAAMSFMAVNIAVVLFNSVFDSYVLANEEFRFQQTRQLATTFATPFVAYVLLRSGFGVVGVAVAQMLVSIVLLLLNASFCINRLGMRFGARRFDTDLFKSVAVFSSWLFANQVFDLINQNVPNVLLGALAGASVAAVFAVSVQIRTVFFSLSTTMSNVFVPKINQIVSESDDNTVLTRLMTRVGRYQAILYLWILGGFVVLGRFFIIAWAGEDFEEAYWLIIAMATPLFIPLVQNIGIEIQRAKNKHMARSVCYLVTAVINVMITAVFCEMIGYWAPAIGFIAHCVLGCGIFMNWYYQKRIGLDMIFFWRRVLPTVGAGVAATGFCLLSAQFLPIVSWLSFLGWGAVYTFAYFILTATLVLTGDERAAIAQKLHRA